MCIMKNRSPVQLKKCLAKSYCMFYIWKEKSEKYNKNIEAINQCTV